MKTKNQAYHKGNKLLVASAMLFVLAGVYLFVATWTGYKPYDSDKKQGILLTGLNKNPDGQCGLELYEVTDTSGVTAGCSHGPDAAEEGIDVTKSTPPVNSATAASNPPVLCDGDGVTGYRTEMIYAVAADLVNNYAQYEASFQTYASNMNNIFVQSGAESGSARNVRFVTDGDCKVTVRNETLTATGDDTIGNTRSELLAKGYNRSDRKYIVWVDATVYCGIAYISGDSRPGQDNPSNTSMGFGRVDKGCWGGSVEAHELMHTLGGVQRDSPNSNGAFHCVDEYDRMCYDDGSGAAMKYICVGAQEQRFDCNKDDYFNSGTPPAGSYLETHWNTANSQFLIKEAAVAPPVAPPVVAPPPPPAPAAPPPTVTPPTAPPPTSTAPPASVTPKPVMPADPTPPPEPVITTPPPEPAVAPKPEPIITNPVAKPVVDMASQQPEGLQLELAGRHINVPYSWLFSGGGLGTLVGLGGAGWWLLSRHHMFVDKHLFKYFGQGSSKQHVRKYSPRRHIK